MLRRAAALLVLVLGVAGCLTVGATVRTPLAAHLITPDAAAQAFRQGIEAAQLGQPIAACPFTGVDAARAWKAGWSWWDGR
jgi:ribosome modulation factor